MEAERLGGFERQGKRGVVRRVGRGYVEDEGVDLGRLGELDVALAVKEGEVGCVAGLEREIGERFGSAVVGGRRFGRGARTWKWAKTALTA